MKPPRTRKPVPKKPAKSGGGDYEVGYGRPPVAHRFKGSGNPKGRPRKTPKRERTLDDFLSESVSITNSNGRVETLTRRELSLLQLATKASRGDHRATLVALEHDRRKAAGEAAPDPFDFDPDLRRSILNDYERQILERGQQQSSNMDATDD